MAKAKTESKIHVCAKKLMRQHKSMDSREAHGVAKGIVTGAKPKKKRKKTTR